MATPLHIAIGGEIIGPITLAVSTTGNDNDPDRPKRIVSGDWSTKPFATIQAAINSLPKIKSFIPASSLADDVVINVAAGTYAGFAVVGSKLAITVLGVRSIFTPATGTQTGTFTAGTGGRILTLTGAGWTANDLVGKMVSITSGPGSGQAIPVFSNTNDTIVLAGRSSPQIGVGSVFSIEQPAVILNSAQPGFTYRCQAGFSDRFRIQDVATVGGYGIGGTYVTNFRADRCVVNAPSGTYGFGGSQCGSFSLRGCAAIGAAGASVGISCQNVIYFSPLLCMAVGFTGDTGISMFLGVGWAYVALGCAVRNCAFGMYIAGGGGGIIIEEPIVDGCTYGIWIEKAAPEIQDPEVNNSTSKAFVISQSQVELNGAVKGTGNAGFGLDASGVGNTVWLASTPTIAGAAGDATVDGVNAVAWSDLAAVGDYAVDDNTGSRIARR